MEADLILLLFALFLSLYSIGICGFEDNYIGRTGQIYQPKCPVKCHCHHTKIDCSKRDLTFVPAGLDQGTEFLELQSNRISGINRFTFKSLIYVKKIDLSYNLISHVDPESFWYCNALQELKLQYNDLKEFPLFLPGNALTYLYLQHNKIADLVPMAVTPLAKLQTLDISFNNLTQLVPGTFINNSQLRQLFLNNNHIIHLHQGYFDNLESLEWLKLSKNRLYNLPDAIFLKLSKLKYLELNRNKLEEIRSLTFHGLKNLEILKMRRNDITTLKDGAFWGLTSIQNLQLDFNNIETVAKQWLYGLANLEKLSLTYNLIKEFEPEGWESCPKLVELDLSGNKISYLPAQSFSELRYLKSLNLAYNGVENLDVEAFVGIKNLEELKLNDNNLHASLEEEKQEDLTPNSAGQGVKVAPLNLFEPLTSLKSLILSNNSIRSLASKCFTGLTSLVHLDLRGNEILSIRNDTFAPLINLREISVNTTSLICDCGLAWLPSWLTAHNKSGGLRAFQSSLTCAQPVHMRGVDLLRMPLTPYNLTCPTTDPLGSFTPTITQHAPSKVEFVRGSLHATLTCEAITAYDPSKGNSGISIVWKKDDKAIIPVELSNGLDEKWLRSSVERRANDPEPNEQDGGSAIYYLSQNTIIDKMVPKKGPSSSNGGNDMVWLTENNTLDLVGQQRINSAKREIKADETLTGVMVKTVSVLLLGDREGSGISDAHCGTYRCVAARVGGPSSASSPRTLVTVAVAPHFTVTPSPTHKRVKVGGTVRLECGASGRPRPEVAWQKDGGRDDFPAARERRMRVMHPTDAHFFITDAKPADAGVYTCRARNSAGTASVNATLTVLEVPFLTKPMTDKSVAEGQTVVIECMADGTPKPSISWFKQDRPLEFLNERYFFAANNQLLIILKARASDAGLFECVMQNTLGNVRGVSKLTVYPPDLQDRSQISSREMAAFLIHEKGLTARDKDLVSDYLLSMTQNVRSLKEPGAASQILSPTQIENSINKLQPLRKFDDIHGASDSAIIEDDPSLLARPKNAVKLSTLNGVGTSMPVRSGSPPHNDKMARGAKENSKESPLLEIVILAVVGCAVFTSILWVALIYRTSKRSSLGPRGGNNAFRRGTTLLLSRKLLLPNKTPSSSNGDGLGEVSKESGKSGKLRKSDKVMYEGWGSPSTYFFVSSKTKSKPGQNEYAPATPSKFSPDYDQVEPSIEGIGRRELDEIELRLEQDYMAIRVNGPVKSCDLSSHSSPAPSLNGSSLSLQPSSNECANNYETVSHKPNQPPCPLHNHKTCLKILCSEEQHVHTTTVSQPSDRISYPDRSFSTFLPPPPSRKSRIRDDFDNQAPTLQSFNGPGPDEKVTNLGKDDGGDGVSHGSCSTGEYDSGIPQPPSAIHSSSLSSCESYGSLYKGHKNIDSGPVDRWKSKISPIENCC